MGKKLQMARTEENISRLHENHRGSRPSRPNRGGVLLAGGRIRLPVYSPTGRNKRKKAAPAAKETKGREVEDSPSASKIGAEVKGTYGDSTSRTKRGRYSQNNKDRQSDRGVEGADKPARRSSEQLGIQWIGSYCPDKQPHFLISRHVYSIGNIFICRNCKKSIWLPFIVNEAAKLDGLIGYLGPTKGYHKILDKFPDVRMMVAKMQDLWYARQKITDDEQFERLVIATMEDKEYDRAM